MLQDQGMITDGQGCGQRIGMPTRLKCTASHADAQSMKGEELEIALGSLLQATVERQVVRTLIAAANAGRAVQVRLPPRIPDRRACKMDWSW